MKKMSVRKTVKVFFFFFLSALSALLYAFDSYTSLVMPVSVAGFIYTPGPGSVFTENNRFYNASLVNFQDQKVVKISSWIPFVNAHVKNRDTSASTHFLSYGSTRKSISWDVALLLDLDYYNKYDIYSLKHDRVVNSSIIFKAPVGFFKKNKDFQFSFGLSPVVAVYKVPDFFQISGGIDVSSALKYKNDFKITTGIMNLFPERFYGYDDFFVPPSWFASAVFFPLKIEKFLLTLGGGIMTSGSGYGSLSYGFVFDYKAVPPQNKIRVMAGLKHNFKGFDSAVSIGIKYFSKISEIFLIPETAVSYHSVKNCAEMLFGLNIRR